ncbi:hypothetical protein PHYSODRAFT_346260 [Phytophthora sojae]|uniref:Uncharacterized protein n=1 Tax=Phytophthora sojae (strain P6497) TaxID=1094619 RepID=G4ZE88_PHYSP|nr:hypothetical protein PHYSODRAFT_346260 [Phytophthora sojae]EGZ17851.1 hypothetical protein PHYSODRAFT_346260 [Phytophthora sojae]|eukprot:XP_009526909.1 hypothetical protein PHYSODRAFT_346260 [Phytophthora sojae]
MKVELQTDSPQECRALPARSIGSYHDGESSCRLFYVDPEGTASEKQAEGVEASNQDEDNIVRELALGAMIRFRKRLSNSRLTRNSEGALSETRITGEFSIMSTGVLPCTAHELTHVLSPDNTDRWNASMVELFGHDYSYGVKLRDHAVQRLQKLGSLITKAGDLALRRRLGTQQLVDPPRPDSERGEQPGRESLRKLRGSTHQPFEKKAVLSSLWQTRVRLMQRMRREAFALDSYVDCQDLS